MLLPDLAPAEKTQWQVSCSASHVEGVQSGMIPVGSVWLTATSQALGFVSAATHWAEVTNEISGTGAVIPISCRLEDVCLSFSLVFPSLLFPFSIVCLCDGTHC